MMKIVGDTVLITGGARGLGMLWQNVSQCMVAM